ncbi:MAG: YbhB/YbcL family Raf kinase inhibitor-like protein [Nanoarchaeota archaeon]|nr:YbhB/YbcL family Raf kinase inhibitor-like protein [Nanoarchaeota archaeon]
MKVIVPLVFLAGIITLVILFLPNNSLISGNTLNLNSTAFENNGEIPSKYTCDGENTNPPLSISGVPAKTKSLVLIMYDKDSLEKEFSHWVVFNMKPTLTEIPINSQEGKFGVNNWNKKEYSGPCPPQNSTHNYVFHLYALNTVPIFSPTTPITREVVESKIKNKVIDEAELTGFYSRI